MRVGIIIPNSNMYPALPLDFIRGVKFGFLQAGLDVDYFIETPGFGGVAESIEAAGKKLVFEKDIDIAFAFISTRVSMGLSLFMSQSKTPLFICNTGENIHAAIETSPYVFYNSLNFSSGAYSLGKHVAELGLKSPLMAMSFYDCGYDLHFAFHQGFESVNKSIPHYYISRNLFDEKDKQNFETALDNSKPDALFAVFCGDESLSFLEYFSAKNTKDLPVFLTPYAYQPDIWKGKGLLDYSFYTYNSWSPLLDNENNKSFTTAFADTYQEKPNAILALGFETAKIASILNGASINTSQLSSIAIRDNFNFNEETRRFSSNHFLIKLSRNQQEYVSRFPQSSDYVLLESHIGAHSTIGWDNPYLCI